MRLWAWVAVGAALLGGGPAAAKPAYPRQLKEHFGGLLSARLESCDTCHWSPATGGTRFPTPAEKPHNAFGARLHLLEKSLLQAGRPADLPARLEAAAREDTDGDGASNLVELLSGRFPGSPKDRPTAAETKRTPALLQRYRQARAVWQWRPLAPVRRPPVPAVRDRWVRNPVDAFILAGLRRGGLNPSPEAPREVLLRRVYLDLVGLPPSRKELAEFLGDRSPDAYERVVDRLLASPRYGERWGRHWMDVWRYSDWDGFGMEVRNSQPHLWRWRDWILRSLNEDRPYDQMVREMLAGDEIAPEDPQTLAATGYLVRSWYKFNRQESLNRMVEGVGKAFLGLTVNCARCHEHKYDPISQEDYFRFQAFFEPHDVRLDRVPGELDTTRDGLARVYDAKPEAPTYFLVAGDERRADKDRVCPPGLPASLGGRLPEIRKVPLPLVSRFPNKAPHVIEAERKAARERVAAARRALEEAPAAKRAIPERKLAVAEKALAALEAVLKAEALEDAGASKAGHPRLGEWTEAALAADAAQRELAVAEGELGVAEAAARVAQAEAASPVKQDVLDKARQELKAAEMALAGRRERQKQPPSVGYVSRHPVRYPLESSGRRTALAGWITARENPLFARVAVNHIWLRHFGQPLVPTVFDFGGNGRPPLDPALVDWLAYQFSAPPSEGGMGYRMKALHRLVVTSSAYRQDSRWRAEAARKDPDNRRFWRMSPRRMEAEIIRDSLLAVSDGLDLTMGGPDLDQNQGLSIPRRSVYFRHSMEKQVEFLATFDQPPPAECYQRTESVVPQQALALANSSLALERTRVLARSLWKLVEGRPAPVAERDFLTVAFQQVLGRTPSTEERVECSRFLREQAALLADPQRLTRFTGGSSPSVPPAEDPAARARESLLLVLVNHNDFVTIR